MRWLLLCLAMVCGSAFAQVVHPVEPTTFKKGACEPAGVSGGAGTKSTLVRTVDGFEGEYWFCPAHSIYSQTVVIVVKRKDYVVRWPEGWRDMTMRAFLDAMWTSNYPSDCRDLAATSDEQLDAICKATKAAALADPAMPTHPRWAATTNGTHPTRATYTASLGADGSSVTWQTITGKVAAVGEPCACNVMAVKVGTQTRCPVARDLTADREVSLSVDGTPTPTTVTLRAFTACSRVP